MDVLYLLLFCTTAAVCLAQESLIGCPDFRPCVIKSAHRRGPDEPYATCKRLITKTVTRVSRCFRDADLKIVQERNCQCKPAEVNMYNIITPAFREVPIRMNCYRPNDARASGCPSFVESCMKTLEERQEPSLQRAHCSLAQLLKKAAMARCERRLAAADLSGCGSIQDRLNSVVIVWDSRLLCSGCDVQKCLPVLDYRNETSHCVMENRIHSAVSCVRGQPSPTCSAVADVLKAVFDGKHVLTYEACKLERKQDYARKYKSWGCEEYPSSGRR